VYQVGIVGLFLFGFFLNIKSLVIIGGCLVILDDVVAIKSGILKPLFPIVSAIILALIIKPFYLGIFWSSAIWHIISIPHYVSMAINPNRILAEGYAVRELNGVKMKCPHCQTEQIITMDKKGTFRFIGRTKGITKVECPSCLRIVKAEEVIDQNRCEWINQSNKSELERIQKKEKSKNHNE
jgi:endogenous inhibitor of DNA gyrase (YacG/DUF329 family)